LICGIAKYYYAWVSASIVGGIPHIRLVEEALNVEREDLYYKLGLQFVIKGRLFAPEV